MIGFQGQPDGEKPYDLVMKTLQSGRKYGQYHRPIARSILFWLNGDSFMCRLVRMTQATISDRSSTFLRLSPAMCALLRRMIEKRPTDIVGLNQPVSEAYKIWRKIPWQL